MASMRKRTEQINIQYLLSMLCNHEPTMKQHKTQLVIIIITIIKIPRRYLWCCHHGVASLREFTRFIDVRHWPRCPHWIQMSDLMLGTLMFLKCNSDNVRLCERQPSAVNAFTNSYNELQLII